VLDHSAVDCVHNFAMCGYCDLCTGYFEPESNALNSGAENQLCPVGAIKRTFIEEPYFEYEIGPRAVHWLWKMREGLLRLRQRLAAVAGLPRPLPQLQRVFHRRRLPVAGVQARVRQRSVHPQAARGPRMTRRLGSVLTVVLMLLCGMANAEERFPPPDFTDHQLPTTIVPDVPSVVYDYVDLAALAVGLSLASYFALVRRSRRGLFLLTIVSLAWFGFWRKGCVCPIGAIQDVTLAVCDPTYAVAWTIVAFFALPLVFTLFFGRTFCAAICPLGAVQELGRGRPVRVPVWLEHTLACWPTFIWAPRCCSPPRARRLSSAATTRSWPSSAIAAASTC